MSGAELGFEPTFGLHAEKRVFVRALAMAAEEETRGQFADRGPRFLR